MVIKISLLDMLLNIFQAINKKDDYSIKNILYFSSFLYTSLSSLSFYWPSHETFSRIARTMPFIEMTKKLLLFSRN